MKLTELDYRNALKVINEWYKLYLDSKYPYFEPFCQAKIKELEKPQLPLYKCIQLPITNSAGFELGELYDTDAWCDWFRLSDLPFHFKLVEPEPEPEKITMQDISNTLTIGFANRSIGGAASEVIDRIKKDHFS